MNHEAGPSSAVPPSASPQDPPEAELPSAVATTQQASTFLFSRRPRVADLIAVLDRLIWIEIIIVYLLDNHFLRLLFRAAVQAVHLTPKPAEFPESSRPQPYIGSIIGVNIMCIVLHIFEGPIAAGEATRGYLHGSIILDFVGQKGPSSKFRLLVLDTIILILQLVALAAITEKKELDKSKTISRPNSVGIQDHDLEERGQARETDLPLADAFELQDMSTGPTESTSELRMASPFAFSDTIASGQAIIASLFLADNVRYQYRAYQAHGTSHNGVDRLYGLHAFRRRLMQEASSTPTT